MTAWANLPNAAHVDRVLADLRARPQAWVAAWASVEDATRTATRTAAHDAAKRPAQARTAELAAVQAATQVVARDSTWAATRTAVQAAAWTVAWTAAAAAAWDACLALIVWDDAADVLALDEPACRLLAACGDHRAVLLLSAVIALATAPASGPTP